VNEPYSGVGAEEDGQVMGRVALTFNAHSERLQSTKQQRSVVRRLNRQQNNNNRTAVRIITIIKTTSVGDASAVGDGLAGWPVTVGVVDTRYGVSQEQTLSGRGARVCTAHRGWLGVVTGISAASTGGVLVDYYGL